MKPTTLMTALLVSGFVSGMALNALAEEDSAKEKAAAGTLQAQAKITRADAEKVALAKVPGGKVKEAELETEDGRLVWSIDCVTPDTRDITEVLVDAKTGAVVSIEKETPGNEAREKADEESKEDKNDHDRDTDQDKD
jgi:uncharacterized membrane protein YkoI